MRLITIVSAMDNQSHTASFEPVRTAGRRTLGWATVTDDDGTLRFPAIVVASGNAQGYTVYTVSDWQAPASNFGDLSDREDWNSLIATGTGQFINPRLSRPSPIDVSVLAIKERR